MYLLMSLCLVFGAMVEFSIVLILKQKTDLNDKAESKDDNQFTMKDNKSATNILITSAFQEKLQSGGIVSTTDTGLQQQHQTSMNARFGLLKFSEDIPSYRKIDIISFILFSVFYFCFNVIYFVVCIHG